MQLHSFVKKNQNILYQLRCPAGVLYNPAGLAFGNKERSETFLSRTSGQSALLRNDVEDAVTEIRSSSFSGFNKKATVAGSEVVTGVALIVPAANSVSFESSKADNGLFTTNSVHDRTHEYWVAGSIASILDSGHHSFGLTLIPGYLQVERILGASEYASNFENKILRYFETETTDAIGYPLRLILGYLYSAHTFTFGAAIEAGKYVTQTETSNRQFSSVSTGNAILHEASTDRGSRPFGSLPMEMRLGLSSKPIESLTVSSDLSFRSRYESGSLNQNSHGQSVVNFALGMKVQVNQAIALSAGAETLIESELNAEKTEAEDDRGIRASMFATYIINELEFSIGHQIAKIAHQREHSRNTRTERGMVAMVTSNL